MSEYITQLKAAIELIEKDGNLLNSIVNGDEDTVVQTDGGPVDSAAKTIAKIQIVNVVAREGKDSVTYINIAAMLVDTEQFLTHDVVKVLGYYEAGDGGGGDFYFDAASTETANGGTVFAAAGDGRWFRRFSDAVNVKWFGAKADGVSDDAQPIQDAIDAAQASGGGKVILPSGVYFIGTALKIENGTINLEGDGNQQSIIKRGGSGSVVEFISGGLNVRHLGFEDGDTGIAFIATAETVHESLVVFGCRFERFRRGVDHPPGTAALGAIDTVSIEKSIFRCSERPIKIPHVSFNYIEILRNSSEGLDGFCRYGINVGGDVGFLSGQKARCTIRENVIRNIKDPEGAQTHGIQVYAEWATITGNILENIDTVAGGPRSSGIYTKSVFARIVNNLLMNAGGSFGCIEVSGLDRDDEGSSPFGFGTIISGNTIISNKPTEAGFERVGIMLRGSKGEAVVSGNWVEGCRIGINGVAGEAVAITGNVIRYCTQTGINCQTLMKDLTISGNVIKGVTAIGQRAAGIQIRSEVSGSFIENIAIVGNSISDISGDTQPSGIVISSQAEPVKNILINSNLFRNMSRGVNPQDGTPEFVTITNNSFSGVTTPISSFSGLLGLAKVSGNQGMVTESFGTASIPSSGVLVTPNHGLAATPSLANIQVTPGGNLGNATKWWATISAGGGSIVIHVDTAPGVSVPFSWKASLR